MFGNIYVLIFFKSFLSFRKIVSLVKLLLLAPFLFVVLSFKLLF